MCVQLLSIGQVSACIGRCRASIYADIKKGLFPPPVKLSPRMSRWREDSIQEWINNLPVADLAQQTEQK